jgi:hypothetical protein
MALPRDLVPGQGVTWVGPPDAEGLVAPDERGFFVSHDGAEPGDGYVVEFPGDRIFCCRRTDVRPDPSPPVAQRRRHRATS